MLNPCFYQEITDILAKGKEAKEANEESFHVLALRKDGSEFATQFSFRFLHDFRFRWAVFVQAPVGSDDGADQPAGELQAIVPTTETATTETSQLASDEEPPTRPVIEFQGATRQLLEAENRNLTEANAKARAELNKERETIKVSRKKEEVFQTQVQTLQGALEQAEARAHESAPQSKDWEKKAANLKKCVDELTRRHAAEQNAAIKAAQRVKELEEQLKRAGDGQAAGKKAIEDQGDTRIRLKAENRNLTEANAKARAELDKERETIKVSRKKEEELQAQIQKLQGALEQAGARAHETAPQSRDWEKKAADLKKSVDELTRRHAAEQNAAVKAAQRVKQLEEQLKRGGDVQAAGNKDVEDQGATRQRLETENRKLIEASDRTKADLEKERVANKLSRKKEEDLDDQVQKLQGALEQAEARSRESATQSRDWEKQAADLKKSVDELSRKHAAEQNAAVKAAQRIKELEEQLKHAEDNQAAGKKDIKDHDATCQRLEAENRNLTEANAKARADLDKERDAIKVSRKKEDELDAQVQKLQGTLEQAETRARESATQSKDLEKKALDLKKSVDELTRKHATEQNAAVKAAQRLTELEEQLKRAEDNQAAGKKDIKDHDATCQRLEAENRNLTEANAKARADLDKERDAIKVSRKKEEELDAQVQKLQSALEQAEERSRESATQSRDWEKKAADFKKSVDGLTRDHDAGQSAAEKRVRELEQQLKRAGDDLAASKAENRDLTESAEKQAALEKKAGELEQRARQSVSSLAKANAELESERVERERAEKSASSAAAQIEKLEEKLKRQVELERASQGKIAELERTIQDRLSEMGDRLESRLDERLQMVERSLAEANSGLEKQAERRRDEGLLADARQQLEIVSSELFTKARRMYGKGLYSDCHELMKELLGILNEKISIFNDAWDLHIQTLMKLGRFDEAKMVVQQRIKAIEDRLGKKHPHLICPLTSLAAILERTGYMFEAEQAMRRVSSIEKSSCVDDLNNVTPRPLWPR